jgi:uncharacterized protein (TIGR01244 family)
VAYRTIKTAIGYLATLLRRMGVISFDSRSIEGIFNYVQISKDLSTSGQPSESDLHKIKDAGFRAIINLAPHNAENSLKDEAATVAALGLAYIHIPVDFRKPKAEDFVEFVTAMSAYHRQRVWVHCAANMRVSAFIYKYRREVLRENDDVALHDLHRIWEPNEKWKAFIDTPTITDI